MREESRKRGKDTGRENRRRERARKRYREERNKGAKKRSEKELMCMRIEVKSSGVKGKVECVLTMLHRRGRVIVVKQKESKNANQQKQCTSTLYRITRSLYMER